MSRIRSSMILLGICVIALGIGVLRLATLRTPLPTGSSYSTEPSGAQGLYDWSLQLGASPSRLREALVDDTDPPAALLVLQPESAIDPTARQAFDTVPAHGGTLIVAGDSLPWLLYVRELGITVNPIPNGTTSATSGDLTLDLVARYRLRATGATPLLVDPAGDWVALRMAYLKGSLVVMGTPDPLLNHSLRDDASARFVFRELMTRPTTIAFDEAHHTFAPPSAGGAGLTVNQLLFSTAPGRAIVYVSLIVFFFLVLTGRRLGPALHARGPAETRRTMYEHVQMLANLYRRAGQFSVMRAAFGRHYQRALARGGASAGLAEALARIETAHSDADLIAAVGAAEAEA